MAMFETTSVVNPRPIEIYETVTCTVRIK